MLLQHLSAVLLSVRFLLFCRAVCNQAIYVLPPWVLYCKFFESIQSHHSSSTARPRRLLHF